MISEENIGELFYLVGNKFYYRIFVFFFIQYFFFESNVIFF